MVIGLQAAGESRGCRREAEADLVAMVRVVRHARWGHELDHLARDDRDLPARHAAKGDSHIRPQPLAVQPDGRAAAAAALVNRAVEQHWRSRD